MISKKLCLVTALFITISFIAGGCSTKIRSYPVKNDDHRKGGIPYFLPKPMLQIKEPIEIKRIESLYAVVDVGGIDELLFPLKEGALDESISKLEKLLKLTEGGLDIVGARLEPIFVSEEVSKNVTKEAEHKSKTIESTKKRSILSIADSEKDSTLTEPFYKSADLEKAISIIWIPDSNKEYELVIDPSIFASSEISLTLSDGWRLEAITSKTGENQLIKELSETLRTIIGAQKEIDIAEIGKEQAIKLKELELPKDEPEEKALGLKPEKKLSVKIKGYVKKSELGVIMPGLYDVAKLLSDSTDGKIDFPISVTVIWSRIKL